MGIYIANLISDSRIIGIGFRDFRTRIHINRMPGWDNYSWAYHGDDGHAFAGNGIGDPYGPTFITGDIIGCCIDFELEMAFYTRNKQMLDVAFRHPCPPRHLYPVVALGSPGGHVKVNFGKEPFQFDILSYMRRRADGEFVGRKFGARKYYNYAVFNICEDIP